MKKLLTFTFICIVSSPLWSQNQEVVDSLLRMVNTDIQDQRQVDAFVQLAKQYSNSDSTLTTEYANKAISLAEQIEYHEGKMYALHQIGWMTMISGYFSESEPYFKDMLALAEEYDQKSAKADALNGIGQINSYQGNSEQALEYFLKSLSIREEINDRSGIAASHNNIALMYYQKLNFQDALTHYLKTLEIRKELNDIPNLALISTNIGSTYYYLGEREKSLEFHFDALRLAKEVGYTRVMAMAETNLGEFYADNGEYDLAIEHLLESVRLIDQMGSETNKLYPFMILGKVYYEMSDWSLARKYLNGGMSYAEQAGLLSSIQAGAELLSLVEREAGNYRAAYDAHVLFKEMADSLINEDATRKLTRLEADYEFQKEKDSIQFQNQKELFAKNSEIERSRLLLFVAIAIGLTLLLTGYLIARSRIRTKAMQAKSLKEISDFKESMTGMIAHDLKNPLSLILNSKDPKNNRQVARQMLQLINNMLDVQRLEAAKLKLHLEAISVKALFENLRDQLEPLLVDKNLQLTLAISETQVLGDKAILERILINLLTNAIKFSPSNEAVVVSAEVVDAHVRISVSDSGKGISREDQEQIFESFVQAEALASGGVGSTGLGLTFCKLAVEAHGSKLNLISELDEGTTFSFELESAGGGKGDKVHDRFDRSITISAEDQQVLRSQVEELQSYQLYQIGEIESQLESLKGISSDVDQWVEEVLNAAYNGNQSHYDELIKEFKI